MNVIRKELSELSSTEIIEIKMFLDTHFSTVFHEVDFNRIASEVFGTELSYVLMHNDTGRLIAICPLHASRGGLLTKTYSNPAIYDIRYGGWVYDRNEVLIPELMEQLKPCSNEALTYWSVPQIDGDDYEQVKNKIQYQTPIIDLTMSLDDILQNCISRKRRQTIRSASRKGVMVEELNSDNLDIFIEQCSHLKTSVGLTPLPGDFFIRLHRFYYHKNKMVAFAAKYSNSYIASGVIIGNKHMIHLWVAGKPKGIVPKGIPRQDLLIWETIKWAHQNESRYFDLCYIDEAKQHDIAVQKLGFSKDIAPFYCINKKSLSSRLLSRVAKAHNK